MVARHRLSAGRRIVVALGAAALLSTSGAHGQAPIPPPSAKRQTAKSQVTALQFTGDGGMVFFTVRAEGAADFEAFLVKLKEACDKGTKPAYVQMAAGWKVFRATDTTDRTQVLYAMVIDPVVKGEDYNPVKILTEVLPIEAQALAPKLALAIVSVNKLNLQNVMKME